MCVWLCDIFEQPTTNHLWQIPRVMDNGGGYAFLLFLFLSVFRIDFFSFDFLFFISILWYSVRDRASSVELEHAYEIQSSITRKREKEKKLSDVWHPGTSVSHLIKQPANGHLRKPHRYRILMSLIQAALVYSYTQVIYITANNSISLHPSTPSIHPSTPSSMHNNSTPGKVDTPRTTSHKTVSTGTRTDATIVLPSLLEYQVSISVSVLFYSVLQARLESWGEIYLSRDLNSHSLEVRGIWQTNSKTDE